jgi:ABC-type bacteriocin/lantibiotic exporter with double-glycine peptidase domain
MNNEILNQLNIKSINYSSKYSSYSNTANNQNFMKELIVNIAYIISMFISTIYIHKGIITIGEFILFNSIVYYFTEPLRDILDFEPKINHLKNIYNRINDLLIFKTNSEIETNKTILGNISIKNLTYSYNGIDKTFNNINLNIKYGSKYLIYGSSGFGKSTLLKIILKYIDDYSGDIFINNTNLKDINKNIISNSMTYVSQNSYINNDTLKNNITYYRDIKDEEYEYVIHLCNLDKLRNNSKLRDNFIIEDNGFNISGGERQKIILARSLLKNSNFIILDEALSEVDDLEEKEILEKLFRIYSSKTIIYVSHKNEIINMFKEKYEIRKEHLC